MKRKLIVAVILLALVFIGVYYFFPNVFGKNRQLEWKEGDELSDFPLELNVKLDGKYTLLYFINEDNAQEMIQDGPRVEQVLGIQVHYVFLDRVVSSSSMEKDRASELKERISLTDDQARFYFLDPKGKVLFTDKEYDKVIEKIVKSNILPPRTLKENADHYIKTTYFESDTQKGIAYFYMPGCEDCERADELIHKSDLKDTYVIKNIYRFKEGRTLEPQDRGNLFAYIYKLNWYPSFLVFEDNSFRFVGQVPVEDLIEKIKGQ